MLNSIKFLEKFAPLSTLIHWFCAYFFTTNTVSVIFNETTTSEFYQIVGHKAVPWDTIINGGRGRSTKIDNFLVVIVFSWLKNLGKFRKLEDSSHHQQIKFVSF